MSSVSALSRNSRYSNYSSRVKSDISRFKTRFSSAISCFDEINKQKKEAKKSLPNLIVSFQIFLTFSNFIFYFVYAFLFGLSFSSIGLAIKEDCLKTYPSKDVLPERVNPNTYVGYKCTGIRLVKENDFFQYFVLSTLYIAIGLQMFSFFIGFIGAVTLTIKNIRIHIALFLFGTIFMLLFFLFDLVLELGNQYLKFFGIFNKLILFSMLLFTIFQVFSIIIAILLLIQWNMFIKSFKNA